VGQFDLYNARTNSRRHTAPADARSGPGTSAVAAEGEYTPFLIEFLRVIRGRLWVILLVMVVLGWAAVGFSLAQTPEYEASIKILVGQDRGITDAPSDAMGLLQLTQTMAEGVRSRPVAETAIRQQNLRMTPEDLLGQNLSVEQIPNTQFIRVTYTDTDPERARRVANAIGEAFSERVSDVRSSANSITVSVWEPAVTPAEPVSPHPIRNGLLALALGLIVGVGLAFVLEHLDDTWRSTEEAELISGVPTFGVIPEYKGAKGKKGEY